MSKGQEKIFRVSSVARVICIFLLVLFDYLVEKSRPDDHFLSGMHIKFDAWQYIVIYTALITVLFNTITPLLLSFKPAVIFKSFLKNKILLLFFYIVELIILPFFLYAVINETRDHFFPAEPTLFDSIFKSVFPESKITTTYLKLNDISMALLALCGIVFLFLFWKMFNAEKSLRQTEEGVNG